MIRFFRWLRGLISSDGWVFLDTCVVGSSMYLFWLEQGRGSVQMIEERRQEVAIYVRRRDYQRLSQEHLETFGTVVTAG